MAKRRKRDNRTRTEQQAGATSNPSAAPSRSMWILGPVADLTLVVGCPLIVVASLTVARGIWSAAAISAFVMVWQIGHHLPGMMRAYGDPALFRRFRVRFIVAPLLLLFACAFAYLRHLESGVIAIASVWGWWHYLMQAYGFSRIYDAKVGSFATTTRWLDQAMCLVWFAAAVVLNDNTLYGFLENFHKSGLGIPSVELIEGLRSVLRGALAGVTFLFFANHVTRWSSGERPSWIKVILMATTFACFWYSTATVTNIVVAYAFFELFHDVQYLTIVWAFNNGRAKKDTTLAGFTRWLFQPRVAFVMLYLAMIAAYGSLKVGSTRVTGAQLQAGLMAVFMTSTLLHYYFDGFIWKLRETQSQASLDLRTSHTAQRLWRLPLAWQHSLLWCLFIVPFLVTMVAQVARRIDQQNADPTTVVQRVVNDTQRLAALAPDSFLAHYSLAEVYAKLGQHERAAEELRLALEFNPEFEPAQESLARLGYR